jgi:hypothetical protein
MEKIRLVSTDWVKNSINYIKANGAKKDKELLENLTIKASAYDGNAADFSDKDVEILRDKINRSILQIAMTEDPKAKDIDQFAFANKANIEYSNSIDEEMQHSSTYQKAKGLMFTTGIISAGLLIPAYKALYKANNKYSTALCAFGMFSVGAYYYLQGFEKRTILNRFSSVLENNN